MLSGDNGILQRATDAKTRTDEAQIKEQRQLDKLADTIEEINVGNEVWAKFYDLDNDGIGETLVLDNHKDFTYTHGTLIKEFENENQAYMKIPGNGCVWNEVRPNTTKIVINGDIFPNNMNQWFAGFSSLTDIVNLNRIKTKNVTNMEGVFQNCRLLTNIDVSSFDTSNVTDMSGMFTQCGGITNINLTSFDTSNVTRMVGMFGDCASLKEIDISSFKTEKVTNMAGMFQRCTDLEYIYMNNIKLNGTSLRRDVRILRKN